MISSVNGILEQVDQKSIVVNVRDIGYLVRVPAAVLSHLPPVGEKVKLFTVQVVREDDISLYGFLNKEERALFTLFMSVSGIGPKLALALISAFPPDRLVAAVAQADVALLSSVSGVGRKTAERIVVELKEKIAKTYALKPSELALGMKGDQTLISDSIAALIALGYSPKEAREAILKIDTAKIDSIEAIIKTALKQLT